MCLFKIICISTCARKYLNYSRTNKFFFYFADILILSSIPGWGNGFTARRRWRRHGGCRLATADWRVSLAGGDGSARHWWSYPSLAEGCRSDLWPLQSFLSCILYISEAQRWTGEDRTTKFWKSPLTWREGRQQNHHCLCYFKGPHWWGRPQTSAVLSKY